MADRRNNSNNDDFDWEAYDARSSRQSGTSRRSSAGGSASSRQSTDGYSTGSRRQRNTGTRKGKKKRKKALSPKQIERRKKIRAAVLIICLIGIIILTGITIGMYVAVRREIKDMNIKNLALNYSSFIYYNDAEGQTRELEQIVSESNRIWIDSEQIPQVMKDAIVSIEDERFYSHNGVDLKRTIGATVKWCLAKIGIGSSDYGGSTITQQVIKNITQENKNAASRKIKEMMRAVALEQELSKDDILTMYLNIVYFAQNCYGVEAAANTYFNKTAADLTLAEAASIAGITQYPARYDPVVNPQNNIEKRNIVLAKMLELGKISQAEYNDAASSDLVTTDAYQRKQSNITSYFSDQVVNDVIADLMNEKGYSFDFATQQVYSGGLKIYATIDVDIQSIMEDVFSDPENLNVYDTDYGDSGHPQSAMVVVDPYSGAVKGLVGGLGEKTDIRGWNRATQAKRQPGSAIKPLSVYAPAIDLGKINEMEVVKDEEITIGSDNWKPKNSYSGFKGEMTIKDAVAYSANIPAVKVLDKIGLTSSFGYLQNKFHIPLTEADKNYSSLALGGLSEGVSPEDMAGAYCTFANSGRYIEPYTYTQVVDASGQVILENKADSSQAISAASAFITSDLLYGVVNSSIGTGRRAQLDCGIDAYGKTGTTDDDYDKWFVGYTPYYVGAVWFGFDQPASLTAMGITSNPSVTAWKLVMDRIHAYLPEKHLEQPPNVVSAEVCDISGLLPNSWCSSVTAYFVSGTQPKQYCSSHSGNASEGSKYKNSGSSQATEAPTATRTPASDTGNSSSSSGSTSSSASSSSSGTSGASSSSGTSSGSTSSGSSSSGSTSSGTSSGSSSGNSAPAEEPSSGGEPAYEEPATSGSASESGGNSDVEEKEMD
ncbi:MAG: PBP1A family penicillin-binding protein [Clostridiales bacterium]|nr:PBP1A family penicillin-binding protein [Clostridiales bacterium]